MGECRRTLCHVNQQPLSQFGKTPKTKNRTGPCSRRTGRKAKACSITDGEADSARDRRLLACRSISAPNREIMRQFGAEFSNYRPATQSDPTERIRQNKADGVFTSRPLPLDCGIRISPAGRPPAAAREPSRGRAEEARSLGGEGAAAMIRRAVGTAARRQPQFGGARRPKAKAGNDFPKSAEFFRDHRPLARGSGGTRGARPSRCSQMRDAALGIAQGRVSCRRGAATEARHA